MHHTCAGAHGDQSVESFQVGIAGVCELHHVGVENRTQALCRASKPSERLRHLFQIKWIALDSIHPFVGSRLVYRASTPE